MLAVSAGGNNSSHMNTSALFRQGSGFLAFKNVLKGEEMQKLKTDKTNNNNNSISLSYPIKNKNTEAEFSTVTEKPFLESMVSP